jgi:molybdate-binding protein/DNA-binding XRE family transcriptional regulator
MAKTVVKNRLAEFRKNNRVGATELARSAGVTRQTIYAIEAGTFIPNTQVALKLAHELKTTVEELFSAEAGSGITSGLLASELLSTAAPVKGQPVRISKIGPRWVSVPVSAMPYYLPEADGVIGRVNYGGRANLAVFDQEEPFQKRLVLAGCDPATNLLAGMVTRITGVEIVTAAASSKLALTWLKEGKVHIAGSHLEDRQTGEYNLPFLKHEFPGEDFRVVTFAQWEEGLVVAPQNPKKIRKIEHLAKKNVRFANREAGSGSRALLDELLSSAGVRAGQIEGYHRISHGHLAAAYTVASDEADCCLATRSAARTFGLDFIPLRFERYDLVMRKQTMELPAAQAFLDVLQRATLRRRLEVLAGYDTSRTGAVLV